MIVQLQSNHALLRRRFREHEPEASLVLIGRAVGGVVHLKNQIGPRRHKLSHALRPLIGRTPGRIHQQQVAGRLMGLTTLLWIGKTRRRERLTYWSMP